MKNEVEFRGVCFEHGRRHFVVPPIDTLQAEKLSVQLDEATDLNVDYRARRTDMLAVIQAAMSRNYPEIPEPEITADNKVAEIHPTVKRFITMANIADVYAAAIGMDGKSPKVTVEPTERQQPAPELVLSGETLTGVGSAAA
jgi:hypothetical protein